MPELLVGENVSVRQLAAVLDSEQLAQLLELLSTELRARYMTEIGTLVTALDEASAYTLSVYGDTASATVGEITIRLVREGGAWHVSAVEQPYGFGDEYYYEGW